MIGYAYFIARPRTVDDLLQPHPIEKERPYEIVKTINLAGIDYENFITDMVADRQFLEDNAGLCSKTESVIRCLLVRRRKTGEGILVVPDEAWVDLAAVLPKKNEVQTINQRPI